MGVAFWHPCLCGHRYGSHDQVKDGGRCRHEGCGCRCFARPSATPATAQPGRPRVVEPRLDYYHRT